MADDPNNRRYDGPMRCIKAFGSGDDGLYISKVGFWLDDRSMELCCKLLVDIVMDGAFGKTKYSIGRNKIVSNEQGATRLDDDVYKNAYMDAIQNVCDYLNIDVPEKCPIVYDEEENGNG